MTKNIKYGFLYLSLVGLLVYFTSCKKTEIEPEATNLIIKVKDDQGLDIPGNNVQVYLFDDSTNFRNAWQNGIYGTNINNQLLNGSQVTFTDLDSDKNYWILIEYNKNVGGQSIPLNNYFTQNTLKNLLENGTTTSVIITLTPFERTNIGFYSLVGANSDDLEIEIFFDGNSVGSIINLSETAPTSITDANVVPVLYQSDAVKHTYYAVGNNGCVWQGEIDVTNAKNKLILVPISQCGFGHVNFWMNNATFGSWGNFTVTLNDNDAVGTIPAGRAAAPGNCDTNPANLLRITRPVGTYVLSVKSNDVDGCVLVKTIEIKEGCNNTPVEIQGCD